MSDRVQTLVERCGYAAAALTIIPIPGSEIIGVMPLHVGMVIGIGNEYGKSLTRESAAELVAEIGATVGLSLVGSRIAMTAGKIILPGLGGLVAAPFMYASTLGIGHVARLYFENGGISGNEMSSAYKRAVDRAKKDFDPRRARSAEARAMAEDAARKGEQAEATATPAKSADVDDMAERLAKLETLYNKGHLSEAEYEKRREKILDEI
ncbi:MAG: SHOCT domain-containing protein [Myxococcota bacterium]